ncbi:MAG: hypothetical protein ACYDC2_04625 [Solirubrobacteraceae bacterium]
MRHRAGASRAATAALTASLLLAAPPSGASAAAHAACRHRNGPRCVAAVRAERAARRAAHWAALRVAPTLKLEGATLSWSAVPGIDRYVLVRIVAGKPRLRHVVTGTSWEPRAIPGATAEYVVRTHVARSRWSAPVTIAFPAAPLRHGSEGGGRSEGNGSLPGAGSSGPPAPGAGSSGPGSGPGSAPTRSETPATEASHATSGFETGMVPTTLTGSEPSTIKALGAHSVRMEFPIGAPASELASTVEAYARVGLRLLPLAGFYGALPSAAEARNLASWAAAYGPHGSFWAGKPFSEVPVTAIEFGNETSYSYQYSDNSYSAVTARAATYATRLAEAQSAIAAAGQQVGLLAQADDGGSGSPTWVNGMFSAVPDLGSRVGGWTVHPYGPTWQRKIDALVSTTAARGASSSIPIYVTELGIAVDNGHCLSENYGWNPCMSDTEAGSTLASVVGGMRARYGSRLHALYLYQAQDQKAENATNNRENYFGVLQSNGASKGAFTATVQAVLASGGVGSPASPGLARTASVRVASYRAARRHRGKAARVAWHATAARRHRAPRG